MNITLERLAHSDIGLLRLLRNANADSFFDDTYITREMQEDWWWRMQKLVATIQFYTIWLNGATSVGFLSVSYRYSTSWWNDESGKWGFDVREIGHILLAPAHRGRGFMAQALIEVRRLYDPLTFWIARVRYDNTASLRLFERAGFWAVEPAQPRRLHRKKTVTLGDPNGL